MAKPCKAQTMAVKKYQSKMHRFTILFTKKEYETITKYIYPLKMSAYIKELIRDDLLKRARFFKDGAK